MLDRELREAARATLEDGHLFAALYASFLLTPGFVYCSYSHLWESSAFLGEWLRPLQDLSKEGILHSASDHTSIDAFIDSRQRLYAHDRARYPAYFDTTSLAQHPVQPSHKTTSATLSLESFLSNDLGRSGGPQIVICPADVLLKMERQLKQRGSRAITGALFAGDRGDLTSEGAIRRAISSGYTQHYMRECAADILTGVRGLELFDQLATSFPFYDIRLLNACFEVAGIDLRRNHGIPDIEALCRQRGTPGHARFLREWASLLRRLTLNGPIPANSSVIGTAVGRVRVAAAAIRVGPRPLNALDALTEFLAALPIAVGSEIAARESSRPRIVFIVATDREWRAVRDLARIHGRELTAEIRPRLAAWSIGTICEWEFLLVRSEMGSVDAGGSTLTCKQAIETYSPQFVLMPGIAFGLKPGDQEIGHVLVAKSVRDYETVKLKDDAVVERGVSYPASAELVAKARIRAAGSRTVHFGEMLCGCKLVDSENAINGLRSRFPSAIGGEMEGIGLAAAAHVSGTQWLLVKGICDWGYGKSDDYQDSAARAAVEFCFDMMEYVVPIG